VHSGSVHDDAGSSKLVLNGIAGLCLQINGLSKYLRKRHLRSLKLGLEAAYTVAASTTGDVTMWWKKSIRRYNGARAF
jgi:hypothetical protein